MLDTGSLEDRGSGRPGLALSLSGSSRLRQPFFKGMNIHSQRREAMKA